MRLFTDLKQRRESQNKLACPTFGLSKGNTSLIMTVHLLIAQGTTKQSDDALVTSAHLANIRLPPPESSNFSS